MSVDASRPLVLTSGDPAGIGGELALAAWAARDSAGVPPFVLLDDPERLTALVARLGWDVPVARVDRAAEAGVMWASALPVLPHPFPAPVRPGSPDSANARAVIDAIDRAVTLVRDGHARALVTNPIAKTVLQAGGFRHPGHTEYLAHLAADGKDPPVPVMMLAGPALRVVPVTVHIPLAEVPGAVTAEAVMHAAHTTHAALRRDVAVDAPVLAVAGLNPHAGEGGAMGTAEQTVIAPAVTQLRAEGLTVQGPLSADTMFHADARRGYDAAVCMYHDQALIPLKTLDFAEGVNVTLGLPFVRTSPDHGTAFDLAGTGRADARSLIAACRTAAEMAANRARHG